ncbi:MAG: PilW family protein [Aquabacterium sp.]|uniref:PilW family protein n=1 Tax=Aquabacterium sp. TaxID=1872578 RepID=UPI003BDB68DC
MRVAFTHRVRHHRGVTLPELMIGLALGLLISAAALGLLWGSERTQRTARALAQMSEDASLAHQILRHHLLLAGWQMPAGESPGARPMAVFACQGGVSADTEAAPMTDWRCLDTSGPDALIVRYEADRHNTLPTVDHEPTDCLGHHVDPIPSETPDALPHTWVDNRFVVKAGALRCKGPGLGPAQPMVDNILDMQIQLGLSAEPGSSPGTSRVMHYLSPHDMGPVGHARWQRVRAVRICLIVRSPTPLTDAPSTYPGCDGRTQTAPTPHLYRNYTQTVLLPNVAP